MLDEEEGMENPCLENTAESTHDQTMSITPGLECDLVMKGGVTSGIVYPQAIIELSERYRFRSIGGTSAGAIAAAMTAAAEFGRNAGGFEKLKTIAEELAKPNGLLRLFHPQTRTKPLFTVLLGYLRLRGTAPRSEAASQTSTWATVRRVGQIVSGASIPGTRACGYFGLILGTLVALTIAILYAALCRLAGLSLPYSIALVSGVCLGLPLALALFWVGRRVGALCGLWTILWRAVPENMYGICTGMSDDTAIEALTPWLHRTINTLAGLSKDEEPLTFAQLRANPKGPPIVLRTITSNLSLNRPYELPFRERLWIAKTAEFRRLFPAQVMTYLEKNAYEGSAAILPDGYFYLPEGDGLPVVVAARMSLSFPLLISAVPLHAVKRSAFRTNPRNENNSIDVAPRDLQRNWFSDGGICSNFPIHLFDTWLPQRPTFGIKLTSFPEEAFDPRGELHVDYLGRSGASADVALAVSDSDEGDAPAEAMLSQAPSAVDGIYLSPASEEAAPEYLPIDDGFSSGEVQPNLRRFLWNVFTTAQNYRDNMQSDLPSYRERIVQIRLKDSEGGLNLAMDPKTVEAIMDKGKMAGKRLVSSFSFSEHQWVRFLTVAARLEDAADEMNQSLQSKKFDPTELLKQQQEATGFPYKRERLSWISNTKRRIGTVGDFISHWSDKHFRHHEPVPEPILQITPRL